MPTKHGIETLTVPCDVLDFIHAILEYLWIDEHRHVIECGSPAQGHVFSDLNTVRKWLDATKYQPQKCTCNSLHTVARSANKSPTRRRKLGKNTDLIVPANRIQGTSR